MKTLSRIVFALAAVVGAAATLEARQVVPLNDVWTANGGLQSRNLLFLAN